MTDETASEWIENTGSVPAGVGQDTRVQVAYRDGEIGLFRADNLWRNDDPAFWSLNESEPCSADLIRFRFLDAPASAAAQAEGAE